MAKIEKVVLNEDKTIAEGRAYGSHLYDFDIIHYLNDFGYKSEVVDYHPAEDGDGYYWKARIKEWPSDIISSKEYHKMTNMSGLDSWNVRFGVEEMQEILIAHGYKIIIHRGKCEVDGVTHDGGEVRTTGERWVENRKIILAVKPEEIDDLPVWITSHKASQMRFENRFNKLIKLKLSHPSWPTNH